MIYRRRIFDNRIVRVVASLPFVYVLLTSFLNGWRTATTDFPNYYTAAVAVRERQPLRNFYDWTWFQREMGHAGIEQQLGAYTPQTPLTMLPMLPISTLPPQAAKRIWLLANLVFMIATMVMLSRIARCRLESVSLVAFAGYTSIQTNFLLGQYYIFLLFLLTFAFYSLTHKKDNWAGVVSGLAFALKLYGGPLLLCFIALRRWKIVRSMIVTIIGACFVAIAIFGWRDILFYLGQILPRSLEGGSIDPYSPGNPALLTFFRRLLLFDGDLNPRPLMNSPYMFFFVQSLVGPSILIFTALAVALKRTSAMREGFMLFVLASILISPSIGSYTYVLLLLPVMITLEKRNISDSCYAVCSYMAINAPLRGASLFPKVWLLLALLVVSGWNYWRLIPPRIVVVIAVVLAFAACWSAQLKMDSFLEEPAQHFERIVTRRGSLFSAFPAFHNLGMFYQSMGRDRYILSWKVGDSIEDLRFDGNVFRPIVPDPSGPVYFELAKHGRSQVMAFDPAHRAASHSSIRLAVNKGDAIISPDHNWVAFTSAVSGPYQVYLRHLPAGESIKLSGGNCNSWGPAWELDGNSIVFASDCGRAIGLPALYRIRLATILEHK